MHLVQILLPLYDNEGQRLPHALHQKVKAELTRRYKGLTAYANTPAEGLWSTGKRTNRDQIVIYEVMTPRKNSAWWKRYRASLEKRFKQQFVVIRAQKIILY